jgi:hypothetical protein
VTAVVRDVLLVSSRREWFSTVSVVGPGRDLRQ